MEGYGYKFNELPHKEKLNSSNYEAWIVSIMPSLFSTGCLPLIFGRQGGPPEQRPINPLLWGTPQWQLANQAIENWDKSNSAGYYTISLNLQSTQKFLIQQNPNAYVFQLWNLIKSHNNNNTKGHRALTRQRWLTCEQSGKVSLDDYISSYSKSYNDLLQTSIAHDAEA